MATTNITNETPRKDFLFKILIIGNSGGGKTSFIRRYVHGVFQNQYKSTIGVDFALKHLDWEGSILRCQMWDVAGQERYSEMTRVYYKDAAAALIVFDLSGGEEELSTVIPWKRDLDRKVFSADDSNIPCLLIGNKCDLRRKEQLSEEHIKEFCEEHGFLKFFESSAKDGTNVNEAMHYLLEKAVEMKLLEDKRSAENNNNNNKNAAKPKSNNNTITMNGTNAPADNQKANTTGGCC